MTKYYSGIATGTTLDTMLANGHEFGVFPSQDIDCQDISARNINATGIHTVTGFLYPDGGIKDSSDSIGSAGKVLSSTGSGLAWIDPSEGSTTNAINVGTNLNSTNADQFVAFMGTSSGNNPVRVDAGIKYNPSTNLLKVGNVELPNLGEFTLGDSQELKMFHKDDTSDVRVEVESNTNYILLTKTFDLKDAAGSKAAITATNPGGVPEVLLYHDGNERLKTTSDGVTITGDLTVTDIIANGNIDLGSDANDTLTISAKVDSDIVPSGTTRDLGGNSDRWRNLYATTIRDKNNQTGTSGQILSSTGTELDWINVGDLAAGSASQIAVTGVSDQTLTYVVLTGNNTGNQSPRSNTNLTFNSTNGTLSATTFSGSGASLTNIPSGQLSGALPAIDGSNLTGISDTTYDLIAAQTGGNNNDPSIRLGSSAEDDDIQIVGGTNVTVTRNSNNQITISSTDTNTNTQLSNEQVQDIVGGMVSGNTESGITVTYQDSDGTLDFSVGTLNQNTTGNASTASALAASVNIGGVSFDGSTSINLPGVNTSGNQNTSGNAATATKAYVTESNTDTINRGLVFCDAANNASGNKDLKYDRNLTYNANSNTLVTDTFQGNTVNVGEIILGGSNGSSGQYIRSTGSGAQWTNFPTIPTNNNQLTNGAGYITSVSGQNYNLLSNKPTIPTNNNQLTNGAGYITATDVRSMNEAASTGQSNTTSNSDTDKVTLSINTVSNSRVLVLYGFEIKHSDTSNKSCVATVSGTNASLVGGNIVEQHDDTFFQRFHGNVLDISSHTGTRTYRISFRRSASGGSASIRNAYLTVIEMSV